MSSMTKEEALALRQGLGLTQEQMAAAMGVRARTVSRWESQGNIPAPSARLMRLMAKLTNDNEEDEEGINGR